MIYADDWLVVVIPAWRIDDVIVGIAWTICQRQQLEQVYPDGTDPAGRNNIPRERLARIVLTRVLPGNGTGRRQRIIDVGLAGAYEVIVEIDATIAAWQKIRSNSGGRYSVRCGFAPALVAEKEECALTKADDRTTQRTAELMLIVKGLRLARLG